MTSSGRGPMLMMLPLLESDLFACISGGLGLPLGAGSAFLMSTSLLSAPPPALSECVTNCTSFCVGVENLCLDNIDGTAWGVLFELLLLCYAFTAVGIIADEHLVVSLETLCVRWSVREDVAGASFMAFGSAAPEVIINAVSTLKAVRALAPIPAAARARARPSQPPRATAAHPSDATPRDARRCSPRPAATIRRTLRSASAPSSAQA